MTQIGKEQDPVAYLEFDAVHVKRMRILKTTPTFALLSDALKC